MTCDDFNTILAEYLGGELDAAALAQADAHLAACPACREHAASLIRAQAAAQRLAIHAEHAEARVASLPIPTAAPSHATAGFRFPQLLRPLAAAALLALSFALGYAARGPSRVTSPPPVTGTSPSADVTLAQSWVDAARNSPDTPTLTWGLLSIARH